MSTATLKVATPTDTTIVMTRMFNAPRRLVYAAMTDPAWLPRWLFHPPGWSMVTCEGDVRVGGKYRWAWNDEHGHPALLIHGEYTEVSPPGRIVHTETMEMGGCGPMGTLVSTLELIDRGERTDMRMTLAFDSREARDGALASGMEHGMEAGYAQLDALLATDSR